jgi:glucose-1-phosphate thymidylyltransferase
MLSGIKKILIITRNFDLSSYKKLLGDGSKYGIDISYEVQDEPRGLVEALIIGENFLNKSNCLMILGDNFFYGTQLYLNIKKILGSKKAHIFLYTVDDWSQFGIVEFNKKNKIKDIHEKPKKYFSNKAVTGLYYYPPDASELAKKIKPSKRNELEITSLNKIYLKKKKLNNINLSRGITWLDTGTFYDLIEASEFVKVIETRQGKMIACLEEVSYLNKWINKKHLIKIIKSLPENNYKNYLRKLLEHKY